MKVVVVFVIVVAMVIVVVILVVIGEGCSDGDCVSDKRSDGFHKRLINLLRVI